ncbi:ARID DNA-binding domain-containing protein [Tanacetum coccineum]
MTNPTITEDSLKYPERVHVTTDYLVEGSDKGNWNNIWYVSSVYKRHMSPMKHLFKRMIQRFKVEGTEEKEKKFLISYGVGEAFVETNEGRITVSNVLFTPEITLNILSLDQLEEQGYMVSYGDNNCRIKYMFDNMEEAVEQETTIEEEDEESSLKATTISWMDGYFRSLDLNEECSLIKGMEDLKMNKEDVHDYVDNEYLSLNGTLYVMKDVLGELPPVIGVIRIDLLGLYKFVDVLGGYMNVTFNDKWYQVAKFLGLAYEHHETVKEVYKEYIGMVKIYYEEAKRSRHGEPGDVAVNCRGTAGKERPQADARIDAEVEEMLDETPRKRSKTEKEDVNMEDVNSGGNYEATIHEKEAGTSSSDDFIIIT